MHQPNPLERLTRLVGDFEPGTVSLIGAGPGDSTLISIRGAVRLAQADVVLHDKLIGPHLLQLCRSDAERIFVGKCRGQHLWPQEQINTALVRHAGAHKRVARLKGGDPFVFGRGGEECQVLAEAGVPYEVVPGITAAFGVPATAGIPLTHRGLSRSFALVTGHVADADTDPLDFAALARMETIALYMGVENLAANCEGLVAAGMDARTPVAVIEWGTFPSQRTVIGTIGDIADRTAVEQIAPPAMVLIGQVVRLREQIEWFESRPLHGRTIAVTRPSEQACLLSGPLLALGADVIEAPTIEIGEIEDFSTVDEALADLSRYDWLVLTSTNGVDATFRRLEVIGRDARALAGVRIAAVGRSTAAALRQYGIRADLVPDEFVGEALAATLIAQNVAGQRILSLRADIARTHLSAALQRAGAECHDLPIYRTVCPKALPPGFLERLAQGGVHWIALTSPSSFVNLLTLLGKAHAPLPPAVRLASIGPATTAAIRDAGFIEAVEADPHDAAGLVAAVRAAVRRER